MFTNKTLKKIADKFWLHSTESPEKYLEIRKLKPFDHLVPKFKDERINDSLTYDNTTYFHTESVGFFKRVTIEPDFSYFLRRPRTLLTVSMFYSGTIPSLPRFIKSQLLKTSNLEECVLFDGQVGKNYFHFFSDVINKIWLIKKKGLDHLPLIIQSEVYDKSYFQYIYTQTTLLKGLHFFIQEKGQYIQCNKVHLLKPLPYDPEYFQLLRKAILPQKHEKPFRKVFLNRIRTSGRYIENFKEIEPILIENGFEIIDTALMPFEEQIQFFQETAYLVSIHGAGNTNILFAPKELRFLEICPENRIAGQYYWLSTTLGIEYDMILGGKLSGLGCYPEGGFTLEPAIFESALLNLLN